MGGSWEVVKQGRRPAQPGGPQHSSQGKPPAQIPTTACWPILQGTGLAVPSEIHSARGIWPVSPDCSCWQHVPGDLPPTSKGPQEKVPGGKEVRSPRTVPTPKTPRQTQKQAGGGDEAEPSLNNHPVIRVQNAEEPARPTPSPFPVLQGSYEKGGTGGNLGSLGVRGTAQGHQHG